MPLLFQCELNANQNSSYENAQTSPNFRFCFLKRAHRRTLLERLWLLLSSGLIFLHISAHEFKCKSIYLRIYESENDDTCADKSCLYGGRRPYYYISMTTLLEANGAQSTECGFLPKELISSIHMYTVSIYLSCGVLMMKGQKLPKYSNKLSIYMLA